MQFALDVTGIRPHEARHVLSHFGHKGGYQAGTFTMALISAIATADPTNKALLREVYPTLVDTVLVAQSEGGIAQLQEIAGGDRG